MRFLFFFFLTSLFVSLQGQTADGFYMVWNKNHSGTEISPAIPLNEEEAKQINCYKVHFDALGRLSKVSYFYAGQASNAGDYGAFEMERIYQEGNYMERFKDVDGNYTTNRSGIWERKYYCDKDGFWIRREDYDETGALLKEGTAVCLAQRNADHEIEVEINLNVAGDTLRDGNGFKIIHFEYNDDGLATLRENRDLQGMVINGDQGYSTVVFRFDHNGQFFEEAFKNEKGELFLHPRFDLAMINWRAFNKYGKARRIYYMDEKAYPHAGRAYAEVYYRENMSREKLVYFDREGLETTDRNGVAQVIYNYDSSGKFIGLSRLDLNGKELSQ